MGERDGGRETEKGDREGEGEKQRKEWERQVEGD